MPELVPLLEQQKQDYNQLFTALADLLVARFQANPKTVRKTIGRIIIEKLGHLHSAKQLAPWKTITLEFYPLSILSELLRTTVDLVRMYEGADEKSRLLRDILSIPAATPPVFAHDSKSNWFNQKSTQGRDIYAALDFAASTPVVFDSMVKALISGYRPYRPDVSGFNSSHELLTWEQMDTPPKHDFAPIPLDDVLDMAFPVKQVDSDSASASISESGLDVAVDTEERPRKRQRPDADSKADAKADAKADQPPFDLERMNDMLFEQGAFPWERFPSEETPFVRVPPVFSDRRMGVLIGYSPANRLCLYVNHQCDWSNGRIWPRFRIAKVTSSGMRFEKQSLQPIPSDPGRPLLLQQCLPYTVPFSTLSATRSLTSDNLQSHPHVLFLALSRLLPPALLTGAITTNVVTDVRLHKKAPKRKFLPSNVRMETKAESGEILAILFAFLHQF
jgi:hypothetical protein